MKKSEHGFTLVELIIVIAVIGVLAAILIPVFSNVIDKANRKSALSDAKNTLTCCITEYTDNGIVPTPDTLFFVHKGSKIFVFGYSEQFGGIEEYAVAFDYDSLEPSKALDEFDNKIAAIMDSIIGEGHVEVDNTILHLDEITSIISRYNTDTLRIRVGIKIKPAFTTPGNHFPSPSNPGTQPSMPGVEPTQSTDPSVPPISTEPTTEPGGEENIIFMPGENSQNGGGVKDGMPENQTVPVGGFAKIPDYDIPHSVTLTAGETNAYAFKSWSGSDGKTYYPGDAIKVTTTAKLTLTAQWESGYTVLTTSSDIAKPFNTLSGKFIMGNDIAAYIGGDTMFPIGFDSDNLYFNTFSGVFDGAGYTLSNVSGCYVGSNIPSAFVYSNSGTISNLNLRVKGMYTKSTVAAGVACYNNATGVIRNVDVTFYTRTIDSYYSSSYGEVACLTTNSSSGKVGGIAAVNSGIVYGCTADGLNMRNYSSAFGGIVGENKSGALVENCFAKSLTLTVADSYSEALGGIVGDNSGTVRSSMCTGLTANIGTYSSKIGGLVGCHRAGEIKDCYVDWSNNNIGKVNNRFFTAGVLAGDCESNSASIINCIGIGRENYTNMAFPDYPLNTASYGGVSSCYLVGEDTRDGVEIITASDLAGRTLLQGLTVTVWDFSSGSVSIPACS